MHSGADIWCLLVENSNESLLARRHKYSLFADEKQCHDRTVGRQVGRATR